MAFVIDDFWIGFAIGSMITFMALVVISLIWAGKKKR